jgi:uncharacterized membrane protein YozB (DUF420 family)
VGLLGTAADVATDLLLAGMVVISALVLAGVRLIRRDRRRNVRRHRSLMLWVLTLNGIFLSGFVVQDVARSSNVVLRSAAPPAVFWPLLAVHVAVAVSALGLAIASWRIARRGLVRGPEGGWDLTPDVRARHRRVSRYYPWLWGLTLATGLLLYAVLYVAR